MWLFGIIGLLIFILAKFIYSIKPEHIIFIQYLWLFYTIFLVVITTWWTWHIKRQIESLKTNKTISDFPISLEEFKHVDNSLRYISRKLEAQEMDWWQQKARQADENLGLIKENSTDPLTGVANRRQLEKYLSQVLGKTTPLSLVMLDIDHFKKVNDTYGHQVGDEVLQHFARTVQKAIRPGDFVARYGGEEFTIICRAALDNAVSVAERVRQAVESTPANTSAGEVRITSSQGVAEYKEGDTAKALKERADTALYEAKETGRNRVVVSEE
ncbi:MAG: Response regulator PleD [Pelotomaculum sp. PtaB.Bin104]|nr:MAG: Response regulator PleD [Pelotomaculum sp. PtaB.Bin104]